MRCGGHEQEDSHSPTSAAAPGSAPKTIPGAWLLKEKLQEGLRQSKGLGKYLTGFNS